MKVALSDLDATLGDHAHCEKKAAATAVKLCADHADRPDLVRKMAKLAQEEMHHFLEGGFSAKDDSVVPLVNHAPFQAVQECDGGGAHHHVFQAPGSVKVFGWFGHGVGIIQTRAETLK